MEIKTYRENRKDYPWVAEDSEGHKVNAATKEAAINVLQSLYHILPGVADQQRVAIPTDARLT